jgi:nitric oxide reductase large subunit
VFILFYWFVVCLLVDKIFPLFASALMLFALVAILFETMEDVLLTQAIASEAGAKGQDKI